MSTLHDATVPDNFPTPEDLSWLAEYEDAERAEEEELIARYPAPELDDELWWEWFCLGLDCANAVPGPELTEAEKATANAAYDAGFEAGLEARWDEVGRLWPDTYHRDRDPWNEARGIIAGHPAYEFDAQTTLARGTDSQN